jgi:hypothetical protein
VSPKQYSTGTDTQAVAHDRRYGITQEWVERRMSNFEYLMALNAFAGRTVQDLTQYPVFPWVLADYVSASLDLTDPSVYRDLSKPMGCQIGSQEAAFQERYRTWADDSIKAFHYGSHYSTAGSVLWYLLRLAPFTDLALELQEGHFDCPDRYSIPLLYWHKSTITDAKGAALLGFSGASARRTTDALTPPPTSKSSSQSFTTCQIF